MMGLAVLPATTSNAHTEPGTPLLPRGATSVRVWYGFASYHPYRWHHLPVVEVKSRRLLGRLQKELNGQTGKNSVRADSVAAGGECDMAPQTYWLKFRYPAHRPVAFGLWCGWAEKQGKCSLCGVQVTMPLAYTLAEVVRRDTHARRLCRQRWHAHRLHLCRTYIWAQRRRNSSCRTSSL